MRSIRLLSAALAVAALPLLAQAQAPQPPDGGDLAGQVRELRRQVEELRATVRELQSALAGGKAHAAIESQVRPPAGRAAEAVAAESATEKELEAELRAAMPAPTPVAGSTAPASGPYAAPPPGPATRTTVARSSAIQNPDISFNGDFTFLGTDNNQLNKANRFSFREAEVGFQAAIDPFARADAFLTFDENGSVEIEEAYATFLTLPYNLQARGGKFRLSFGKNNLLHRHALPQTDRPFVEVANFGEEGVSGAGIGLSYLVPNPWDEYLLLTGEIVNDLSEPPDAAQGIALPETPPDRKLRDFAYVAHIQSFFDLDSDNNLELGGSALFNLPSRGTQTKIYGVDLSYRWRPLRRSGYHQFLWRTEAYFTQKRLRSEETATSPLGLSVASEELAAAVDNVRNSVGLYSYGEYRLSQRFWLGTRFDWTEIPAAVRKEEWGIEPYLTFAPTEFGFFRIAYQYAESDQLERNQSNRVWLQYNFSIGPHAAHPF